MVPLLALNKADVNVDSLFNQTPRMINDFLDSAKTSTMPTTADTPKMKHLSLMSGAYKSILPKSSHRTNVEDIHPVPGKSCFVKNTMSSVDSKRYTRAGLATDRSAGQSLERSSQKIKMVDD